MKLRYSLPILLAMTTPALAQKQWVPFTVDMNEAQALQAILDHNVPPAYSPPIAQWINALEQKAQDAKEKEAEKAKTDAAAPKGDKQ